MANWRRNETSTVRKLWQLAEPPDDGRRRRCSHTHCHRFPLERLASLLGEECHIVRKSVKAPAEALGWSLASGRGDLSGLSNDEKTGLQWVRRGLIEFSTMSHGCTTVRRRYGVLVDDTKTLGETSQG